MKPDTSPSWRKLAAAGRRDFRRESTTTPSEAEPAPAPIAWLPELGTQVHASFLRQIWRRWALAFLLISAAILAFLLLADRMLPSADHLSPRISIPEAP